MQNDLKWNNYLPILILIKAWQRFCSYGWTLSPKGRIGEVYIISNYFSCIYLCISHFHLQSYWVSKRKLIKKWKNRCFGVKNTVQCFSIKLKVTCQKSSHFWVKQKNWPQIWYKTVMLSALQLCWSCVYSQIHVPCKKLIGTWPLI